MTNDQKPQSPASNEPTPAPTCCDSVLLATCCGTEVKPKCCGLNQRPRSADAMNSARRETLRFVQWRLSARLHWRQGEARLVDLTEEIGENSNWRCIPTTRE